MNESSPYNATVMARIDITPRLAILQVKPDDLDFAFTPGQYTVLGLLGGARPIPGAGSQQAEQAEGAPDKLIKRAYSISSGSVTREYVEFYIALVSDGELTPRLFSVAGGDRIFMGTRAKGMFTIDHVPEEQNLLMVATGTGIAPYISMLRSQARDRPAQYIAVVHGASYSWDLGYRNELEELAARRQGFAYAPVVSRPDQCKNWNGLSGRLPALLEKPDLSEICGFDVTPQTTHVFLCGNPAMIEDVTKILTAKGHVLAARKNPGNLHMEKYW